MFINVSLDEFRFSLVVDREKGMGERERKKEMYVY